MSINRLTSTIQQSMPWLRMIIPSFHPWDKVIVLLSLILCSLLQESKVLSTFNNSSTGLMDAGSKYLIVTINCFAVFAAVLIALNVPYASLQHQTALFWIGVPIFLSGVLLRRHCFQMLGKSFSAAVIVYPDQVVVDSGVYRYVQHPSYTGTLIQFFGFGLILANWTSILILVASAAGVLWYRSLVEEKALIKVIGNPYISYVRRTKRFIPFLI